MAAGKKAPNPKGIGGFQERPWDRGRGMSTKAAMAWHRASERAAELAELQLEAHLMEAQASMDADDRKSIIAQLTPQINTLIREAASRVGGTPRQSVDLSSEDGSMSPNPNVVELVAPSLSNDDGED